MARLPRASDGTGGAAEWVAPSARGGVVVGVDLGGTSLRAGAVDGRGRVLASAIVPSSTGLPATANPDYLARLIAGLLADAGIVTGEVLGIGIGATGPVDVSSGRIHNPYTLPAWSDLDLTGTLAARFGVPVHIDNDAAAAALGEYWRGAGAGSERLLMITAGTGIGGALVMDGRLYRGAAGFHPEMGHQVVDPAGPRCYCGANGCWEQFAAGPAIARAWAAVRHGRGEGRTARGGARGLFAAARAGDADATRLVGEIGRRLGQGLINALSLLAPDRVVLGGGIARHFALLEPGIRAELARVAAYHPVGRLTLVRSRLGDRAGVLGGAYMALFHETPIAR